jgi:uncharacterized SAM-binding protein YcdF (DUF218 family)
VFRHVTTRIAARRFGVFDTSRMRSAFLGAALGCLAAFACMMAGLPVISGHAAIDLIAGIALGVIASLAPMAVLAPIAVAMVVALAAATLTPVMSGPVASWVRRDSIPSARLDAVVVLSSSVTADSVLDPVATERLLSALQLMRGHEVATLITTRPAASRRDLREVSNADQRALITLAGDTSRWREVGPVRTTREEAVRVAEFLAPAASRTIAVVTSPLHTRRACAAFEAVGFRVVCVPSTERMYSLYAFSGVRSRLIAVADWAYERLGMIEYRARGWAR